jgi:hypothetical protein
VQRARQSQRRRALERAAIGRRRHSRAFTYAFTYAFSSDAHAAPGSAAGRGRGEHLGFSD